MRFLDFSRSEFCNSATYKNILHSSQNSNLSKNRFGTGVNVTSYTSNNKFTVPNDGVIQLNGGNVGNFIRGNIDGVQFCNPVGYSPYAGNSITPIRKGQEFYVVVKEPASASQSATYYPYV